MGDSNNKCQLKMKKYIVILPLFVSVILKAQDPEQESKMEFDIGLGLGIDYGGIGIRGTFKPIQQLGLFAAGGYNLNSIGFNAGAQWHFVQKNRHNFFLTGMYGYNAVIIVSGDINDKATYYGFSAGVGYQLTTKKSNLNFWNFELLVPIRNSNYKDDLDALKTIGVDMREPFPFVISIGHHFKIQY
jgi:hypothetical protein